MADIVSPKTRSWMMAGITGKDTKPEVQLRSALHRRGFRFRLHGRGLPGKPDLVFRRHGAVLFVNGCFWHGHDCHLFRLPATRTEWWRDKIEATKARDSAQCAALQNDGWRVGTIWECAMRGRSRIGLDEVAERCAIWLQGNDERLEVYGHKKGATV
ncbi:DNA mismatch endonuclease Vsr [Pacificimonas sp. WHA3]|uniref:DNA mismatch endonuclease Vsr n=1 Tax=Pacificimonas pallii TaxID=2827236 RepID=A0ABS6SHL4_9SPHN|nr:very short patch repair endonuclease [Pacificimonas pallii]MBV7257904.1 DNA mismatch endonuclease Vsr [Pacificimonas pallii]